MLILASLARGPEHGFGIAERVRQTSAEVLRVEEGSLYPALQRLEQQGLITSSWGTSAHNRRARFYKLTAKGRRQLAAETTRWELLARAVHRVIRPVS